MSLCPSSAARAAIPGNMGAPLTPQDVVSSSLWQPLGGLLPANCSGVVAKAASCRYHVPFPCHIPGFSRNLRLLRLDVLSDKCVLAVVASQLLKL